MKKNYLLVIIVLLCNHLQSINLLLLKGTHGIVAPDYSPVMGMVFWDCEIAEQWYRISPKYQTEEHKTLLTNELFQKVLDELHTMKNDSTQDLISVMYHIAGGSFAVTNADQNPVKDLKPRHIGQILRLISIWNDRIENADTFKKYQEALSTELKLLQQKNSRLNGEIRALKNSSDRADELKEKQEELENGKARSEYLNKIITAKDAYTVLETDLKNLLIGFKIQYGATGKAWSRFATSLIGSLKECNDNLYVKSSTQGIILGYLLATSNTREDLQEYFRGFLNDDSFSLKEEQYSKEEIETALSKVIDVQNFTELADCVSLYFYKYRYASALPKIEVYRQVNYRGISFPDCMDTTIRMLTNIVTYSLGSNTVLGVLPEGLKFNKAIEKFYQANELNRSIAEIGNQSVHQDWIQVISNISNCIYKSIVHNEKRITCVDIRVNGFIPVDIEFTANQSGKIQIQDVEYESYDLKIGSQVYVVAKKQLEGEIYLLIPKRLNLVCCEIRPNLRNVITALNYIFDLNLYSSINDIFEQDFISKNFEKICKKFQWKTNIELSSLDKNKNLIIPIIVKDSNFWINIYTDAHGYIFKEYEIKQKVRLTNYQTVDSFIKSMILSSSLMTLDELELIPPSLFKNSYISFRRYALSGLLNQIKLKYRHMLIPHELKNYLKLIVIKILMQGNINLFELKFLFNDEKLIFEDIGFSKDFISSFRFNSEEINEQLKKATRLLLQAVDYYDRGMRMSEGLNEPFGILYRFSKYGLLTHKSLDEIEETIKNVLRDEYHNDFQVEEYCNSIIDQLQDIKAEIKS